MNEFEPKYFEDVAEETGPNFAKYIRGIWQRKWLIVAIALIMIVPFYYKAKHQIPVYSTSALIRIKEVQPGFEKIFSREREVEFKTRTFAENVVTQLGLTLNMDQENGIQNRTDVFQTFYTTKSPISGKYKITLSEDGKYRLYKRENLRNVCIDSTSMWDVVDSERAVNGFTFRLNPDYISVPKEVSFTVRSVFSAVNTLLSKINIAVDEKARIMKIGMNGTDPELLTKTVNRLAEYYVQKSMSMESRDARLRRQALEQRLAAAERNLHQADEALEAFRKKYPQSLDAEKIAMLKKLQTYDSEQSEIPKQIELLQGLFEKLESAHTSPDSNRIETYVIHQFCNFPVLMDEASMIILKGTLTDQEKVYEKWVNETSESHPVAKDHWREIKKTHASIAELAQQHLTKLYSKKLEVTEQRNLAQAELGKFPAEESRLMELERRKKIAEEQYSSLYAELQKAEIAEAVEMEYMDILDPAIRPNRRINASAKKTIAIGGAFGVFLGLGLAFVLEFLDKSIRTVEDIKSYLKLDVLGAIPNIDFRDVHDFQDHEKVKHIDHLLVTHDYSPSPIGESYRALRTNLMYSKNVGRIHGLVITSTDPSEGKSFTAANLAIILAQQRTNTLLVDADLRRGVLHNTFKSSREPGLTNFLTNASTLTEVVKETHIPNLSIISCGSMIPNPSELLGSLQMRRFLEECRRKFDIVVFDTPPLTAATDAVVLGTQTDAVVLVVRAGVTNKNIAKERLQLFKNIPANLIGVILNGADSKLIPESYSYYHY